MLVAPRLKEEKRASNSGSSRKKGEVWRRLLLKITTHATIKYTLCQVKYKVFR
jgi:hypothetical protein